LVKSESTINHLVQAESLSRRHEHLLLNVPIDFCLGVDLLAAFSGTFSDHLPPGRHAVRGPPSKRWNNFTVIHLFCGHKPGKQGVFKEHPIDFVKVSGIFEKLFDFFFEFLFPLPHPPVAHSFVIGSNYSKGNFLVRFVLDLTKTGDASAVSVEKKGGHHPRVHTEAAPGHRPQEAYVVEKLG